MASGAAATTADWLKNTQPIDIQAAARAPELFAAYIGVSQMSYQLKSEVLSYEYMARRYREIGNMNMARRLEAAPPTMSVPLPASYMKLRFSAAGARPKGRTGRFQTSDYRG